MGNQPSAASASSPPRTLLWGGLAVVTGMVFLYLLAAPRNTAAIGTPLPHLQLEPLTGTTESVGLEELNGQVVLINYWGTWCPPCRVEFPHLLELYQEFQQYDHFRFLSVSCNPSPGGDLDALAENTEAFLERYGAEDLPTYADPQAESRRALMQAAELPGFSFPTTLLLDGQGVIRGLWIGYTPEYMDQIQQALQQSLGDGD